MIVECENSGDNGVIHSLAASYYTDANYYIRERDSLMATTWQFAGHGSSLANVGDYLTLKIAEESIFCIRSANDKIQAFYNVCQHRAHQLLQGEGNVRYITCPYHSWAYELNGKFKTAPHIQNVVGFDKDKIKLSEIAVEDFCGFIFVNLNKDAKPMDDWFLQAREQLSKYVPTIKQLKPLQWLEVPENCNWKISVENYSECYHCLTNHPTFSSGVVKPETYDIQPQGYCLRHTTECQNLEKMSYPIDLNANPYAGSYSSWFLWPMFSFQVYPGNVLNTYHWRPQGVDKVAVWRGWYSISGEESAFIRQLAKQDRETTVAEDIGLVESVHRGMKSRGYNPGPLVLNPACGVNSEHSIRYLQQWMRSAVEENTINIK